MLTTTGDIRAYERSGRIRFEVDGQAASLTIFRSEDGYFLPSPMGWRAARPMARAILEPEELGRPTAIDFNLAYNPYCAYNERWSCRSARREPSAVPIRAGEQAFHTPAS